MKTSKLCKNCKFFNEGINVHLLHEIHMPSHCRAMDHFITASANWKCSNDLFEERKKIMNKKVSENARISSTH